MKWTDNIQHWRGLKPESRREICWRRIPRQVALSMSFEREAVDLSWLEKLHRQAVGLKNGRASEVVEKTRLR